METKTVHLTGDLLRSISFRVKMEGLDESTAIREMIKLGVIEYAINLYKTGKITLAEAAELSNISLRRMLDVLEEHGVKGNITMKQQIKALDYAKKL